MRARLGSARLGSVARSRRAAVDYPGARPGYPLRMHESGASLIGGSSRPEVMWASLFEPLGPLCWRLISGKKGASILLHEPNVFFRRMSTIYP